MPLNILDKYTQDKFGCTYDDLDETDKAYVDDKVYKIQQEIKEYKMRQAEALEGDE